MKHIQKELSEAAFMVNNIRLYEHTNYDVRRSLEKVIDVLCKVVREVELLKDKKG